MARKLEIKEQPGLPVRKQVEIAADGIHHRLLRSALTLGMVVLAVAFLANVLVENRLAVTLRREAGLLAAQQRELAEFATLIEAPLTGAELGQRLAGWQRESWQLNAVSAWLQLPDASEAAAFHADCVARLRYETWFDALPPGKRRLLVGNLETATAFASLGSAAARDAFAASARAMPLRLPAGFLEFCTRYPAVVAAEDSRAAQAETRRRALQEAIGKRPFAEWLAADAPDKAAVLSAAGLAVPEAKLSELCRRAAERAVERQLLNALTLPAVASAWARDTNTTFEQRAALAALAREPARAAWLVQQLAAPPTVAGSTALDEATVSSAAARLVRAREIMDVEERLINTYGREGSLSATLFWLLVVSLLVCSAGITNAMLVSVLERFREIATMKCLGALNGFIARIFLIEAMFLGLVGSLLGVVLGSMIGIARMWAGYGGWVWQFFPWSGLAGAAVVAALCGVALATLSALYPAYAAARMHPIEAMRLD